VSTTEVFIEQVIIGLLVLLIGSLLASEALLSWLVEADLGNLVVAAAMAYLVGIVFDRMGDTVLGRLERHHRLHFAAEIAADTENPAGDVGVPPADPFPEGRYRVLTLGEEGASKYGDYLRSRIRLTRALVYAAPALTLAASVATMASAAGRSLLPTTIAWVRTIATALVVAVYTFALLRRSRQACDVLPGEYDISLQGAGARARDEAEGRFRPPVEVLRTVHMATRDHRRRYRRATGNPDRLAKFVWANERELASLASALCVLGIVPAALGGRPGLGAAIAVGGLALTAVSGWCWWRITRTFFVFLRDAAKLRPADPQVAAPPS
jgi:hypothetical protein